MEIPIQAAGGPGVAWAALFLPLARLLAVMAVSLAVAQVVESLRWAEGIARLAAPLVRFARMGPAAGASFALAFFSPAAANALLAEARGKEELSRKELIAANIFNSTPTFLVHLPSLVALAFSFLGAAAAPYICLVLLAAALRTAGVALYGRLFFPPRPFPDSSRAMDGRAFSWREALAGAARRLKRRLKKMLIFTVPIYCALFFMQHAGAFAALEAFMAAHAGILRFISPQALSIVALYVAAENGAAFGAAAALLNGGAISPQEAVIALLVGNILSSPVRAFRHQLPSYAGFFSPGPALMLVAAGQTLRVLSLAVVTAAYCLSIS